MVQILDTRRGVLNEILNTNHLVNSIFSIIKMYFCLQESNFHLKFLPLLENQIDFKKLVSLRFFCEVSGVYLETSGTPTTELFCRNS